MIPSVSEVSKLSSLPINEAIEQPEVQNAIGKKHALKRYDQFTISKMIIKYFVFAVKHLEKYGVSMGLEKVECPQKVFLTLDEWTPDTGLVTAAFKIRRRFIILRYENEVNALYK